MDRSKARRIQRRSLCLLGAVGALLLLYGMAVEPFLLQETRLTIPLTGLTPSFSGFRIVHLTDLHYGPSINGAIQIRQAVRRTNAMQPDLIVITGDFVTTRGGIEPCARLLAELRARHGVIAVLGNHDYWTDAAAVTAALQSAGITVLVNASLAIERNGERLWIAGLDDSGAGRPHIEDTLRGIPAGEPVVLLSHSPDIADKVARFPVGLQLSGHSHGGQIHLLWIDTIITPPHGRQYPHGLYRIDDLLLYTATGIGMTFPLLIRLNCRPEMLCVTLTESQ